MNNKEEYINAVNEIKPSEELKRKTMYKIKEKKPFRFPYKLASAMSAVLVLFGVFFMLNNSQVNEVLPEEQQITVNKEMKLPTVGNLDNLLKILNKTDLYVGKYDNIYAKMEMSTNSGTLNASTVTSDKIKSDSSFMEYSETNVQVSGVDEDDIVKTDGNYIYYINENKLVIAEAGDNLRVVSEIEYNNEYGNRNRPVGMFLDGNKLVVIINKTENTRNNSGQYLTYDLMYTRNQKTKAITYDITDRANPVVYNEFEIDGSYADSRMINNTVYLITNKNIYTNYPEEEQIKEEELVQTYTDGVNGACKQISLSDICYIPESEDNSYLNIIAIDTQTKRDAKITTILGAGHTIYASTSNIYVTRHKAERIENEDGTYKFTHKTVIYKFSIDGKNVDYEANGEVPGEILNQYSMDEYKGNFRIAVTNTNLDNTTTQLYILDNELKQIGAIESLVENERIYAVRFMGEKAYVVTFREMDPLFIIDLSNPAEPKVLGELELPGYSSYLHPYDENHIIGIGEDIEVKRNRYGNEYMERHGIKLSMFDISDPSNPIEVFKTKVAPEGVNSSSNVSYNHKELLFSKEKNLLAFPVSVYKVFTKYSEISFQGIIAFGIDMENGFYERGRITNMEITKGREDYEYKKEIKRAVYIGNDIYTLSNTIIKRTDMNTFEDINQIEMEYEEMPELVWNTVID